MDDPSLSCTLCEEKYGDDRVPRNLGCGHCLCTSCADEILRRDSTCVECQRKIIAPSASDLVVNYPLLRLTRALASAETLPRMCTPEPSAPDGPSYEDVKAGYCDIHNAELAFRCMRCCKWICRDCQAAFHFEPPRGHCRVVPLIKAFEEMKASFIDKGGTKFSSAKQIKLSMDKEMSALEVAVQQHKMSASSIKTLLEEAENFFRNLETKLELQNQNAVERLSEIQDMVDLMQDTGLGVKRAKTTRALLEALELANSILESVEKSIVQEQHRPTPILPKMLSQGKYELQGMLESGKQVYTTYDMRGRHYFTQVTSKDGMLHLHALTEGAHATHGVNIPYHTVRRLVPRDSPTVFMDIGLAGILRGRVYIRMFGDTTRSRQTVLLCSGEPGPSYKHSCFYGVERSERPREILRGGDYENNNGSGGKAIIRGITSGGVYRTEIVAGLLASWPADQEWRLGAFDIYLHQSPGVYDNSGHGIVTSGLDILRSVARHHPIQDSVIQDCGLVIHL